jgi:subtilisin family serine protease
MAQSYDMEIGIMNLVLSSERAYGGLAVKSKSLSVLCLILSLSLWSVSSTQANTPAYYAPGEIILRVQLNVNLTAANGKVTSSNAALQAVLDEVQALNVQETFSDNSRDSLMSRYYTLAVSPNVDVIEVVTKLNKLECIQIAEPNFVHKLMAAPTDASYANQWGLMKINAANAWDLFTGSSSTLIAVLDSGVDWEHQDLAANIWNNADEIAGDGIDNDNNGYVDDVRGWDFSAFEYTLSAADPDAEDEVIISHYWKSEDNNPGIDSDEPFRINAHGTHVAGIIGGVGNNTVNGNTNIVGTMWNCTIMPVRVGHYTSVISTWIARGVRYATDNGAKVINMSFGGASGSSIEDLALQYAHNKGVVLCAAAGNEYTIQQKYPASFNNVISVAATDQNDKKADFSNYGETIDISAPGVDILSTVLSNAYDGTYSGTSMACPFVSGAAGMILGYGEALGKKFTPGQVEYILEQSADNIDAENPEYTSWLGAGRLNLANALTLAQSIHPMVSSIQIGPAGAVNDQPQVNEHSSINLRAIAIYSDGATEDITAKVAWSVRPVRYGSFCSYEAGKFIALQVPADREAVVTASYAINGNTLHSQRSVTILNDPSASPITITGPDQVDPLSSNSYHVQYTDPEGHATDITALVSWEVITGAQYANFDPGQAGLLLTKETAAGQLLTIQATYIDESTRRAFMKSYNISVRATAQQVAGLFLTAPGELVAGSTTQLSAMLIMAGQAQSTNVTASSTWSVSPAGVGSFIEPGLFQAGNVSSETTVTLTAEYVRNGQTYTAQLSTKVIPAVAMGEITTNTETKTDEDLVTETGNFLDSLTACPVAGILTMVMLMGGLVLIREN